MPSAVPLNNAIAQNSLDFNSQNPTNKGGLFRYKINNYGAAGTHNFTNNDLNSVCIFSRDVTVTLNSANFTSAPPAGSEILFYSNNGYIRVNTVVGSTLYSTIGNFTVPGKAGKLIYTTANSWFFASLNATSFSTDYTDCCVNSSQAIYQVSNYSSFDAAYKTYADAEVSVPFNGLTPIQISDDPVTISYYNIVNGQASSTGGCGTETPYDSAFTFYTNATTPVTLYSVGSYDPSVYSNLLGKKFFTAIPNSGDPIYSCYSTDQVANGASAQYYGSTAQYPSDPVTFLNGYAINYNGIPYMGT